MHPADARRRGGPRLRPGSGEPSPFAHNRIKHLIDVVTTCGRSPRSRTTPGTIDIGSRSASEAARADASRARSRSRGIAPAQREANRRRSVPVRAQHSRTVRATQISGHFPRYGGRSKIALRSGKVRRVARDEFAVGIPQRPNGRDGLFEPCHRLRPIHAVGFVALVARRRRCRASPGRWVSRCSVAAACAVTAGCADRRRSRTRRVAGGRADSALRGARASSTVPGWRLHLGTSLAAADVFRRRDRARHQSVEVVATQKESAPPTAPDR